MLLRETILGEPCPFGGLTNILKHPCFPKALTAALALLLASQVVGQAPKDPVAVSTINSALDAMGGQSAFAEIQDATVSGQFQGSASDPSSRGTINWQAIGVSLRCDSTSQLGTSIATANNGTGYIESPSGNVSAMNPRQVLTVFPFQLPGVVLLYLLNEPERSLSVVNDTGNSDIVHIRSVRQMEDPSLTPVTQQDWYIDLRTGLPSRVDYYLPNVSNPSLDGTASVGFATWQKAPTLLSPQNIQLLNNGTPVSAISLGVPQLNLGLSGSIFQLP